MPILERETSLFPEELLSCPEFAASHPHRSWRAVLTKARNEKAFARDLLRQEIPFYLPTVPRRNRVRSRIVYSHVPIFTGYVFVFADEDERLQSLRTNRVSTVLDVNDQDRLRHELNQVYRLVKSGAPLTLEERLQPGQLVRIKSGVFEGIEGVITQRRGDGKSLLVAVHFLQRGVSLAIDDFMVEPV